MVTKFNLKELEMRKNRTEYMRKYRATHKEIMKVQIDNWHLAHKDTLSANYFQKKLTEKKLRFWC
jgi:hypothetical protein